MTAEFSDYVIESAASLKVLTDRVRANLRNGWEPYGFPFVLPPNNDEHCRYGQAMVKITIEEEQSEHSLDKFGG